MDVPGTSGGLGGNDRRRWRAFAPSRGDLSFVVITRNPSGAAVDTNDADPWFMEHR
jgi:hypothetical protein